ncbi:MAG: hypothetical protein ACI303_06670 [Lepagella sp.]
MKTSLIGTLTIICLFLFTIFGCTRSNSNSNEDSDSIDYFSEWDEQTVTPIDSMLSSFYLGIPINLTMTECSSYMDQLERDSLITEGNLYTSPEVASDFEHDIADIRFATSAYRFESNFAIKMSNNEYKDLNPRGSIFFYNNSLLAIELTFYSGDYYTNIVELYRSKYGTPQIVDQNQYCYSGKFDEYKDTSYSEMKLFWKEDLDAIMTEWVFLNSSIKVIKASYKYVTETYKIEHITDTYKKTYLEDRSERDSSSVFVFYINNSTIKLKMQDQQHQMDSLDKEKEKENRKKRIEDSIQNSKAKNLYESQSY